LWQYAQRVIDGKGEATLKDGFVLLEPGKLADIIGVQGNPLKDIRALESATFVMKGGAVIVNK
jgi:hypothetical protein